MESNTIDRLRQQRYHPSVVDPSSPPRDRRHKFFNTNNLWVNLDKLDTALTENGGLLKLPLIMNKKTVNPRDAASTPVFQLETAMGSAIGCFDDASAIVVPRSRFAPVKTTNDLFVLRSDAYAVRACTRSSMLATRCCVNMGRR